MNQLGIVPIIFDNLQFGDFRDFEDDKAPIGGQILLVSENSEATIADEVVKLLSEKLDNQTKQPGDDYGYVTLVQVDQTDKTIAGKRLAEILSGEPLIVNDQQQSQRLKRLKRQAWEKLKTDFELAQKAETRLVELNKKRLVNDVARADLYHKKNQVASKTKTNTTPPPQSPKR